MKRLTVALIILMVAVAAIILAQRGLNTPINTFAQCKAAGYPIQESYPEVCVTPDKKSFINPAQRSLITN